MKTITKPWFTAGVSTVFIERSIRGALDFMKEAVFSDEIASRKGLMQSVGPKVKILSMAAALLAACLATTASQLALIYLAAALAAFFSGIGILYFIKRVWVFIPLFTALIALPAVFTEGLGTACLFVLRVAACVSIVVLVTVTTRHNQMLGSIRSFGVPAIFIQVLDMTHRYIFLFITTFEDMHRGLKARLAGNMSGRGGRRWVAGRIGSLFRRSVRMSEEVYMAMTARGYSGE